MSETAGILDPYSWNFMGTTAQSRGLSCDVGGSSAALEIPLHGETLGEGVQTEFHKEIVKFQVASLSSPC